MSQIFRVKRVSFWWILLNSPRRIQVLKYLLFILTRHQILLFKIILLEFFMILTSFSGSTKIYKILLSERTKRLSIFRRKYNGNNKILSCVMKNAYEKAFNIKMPNINIFLGLINCPIPKRLSIFINQSNRLSDLFSQHFPFSLLLNSLKLHFLIPKSSFFFVNLFNCPQNNPDTTITKLLVMIKQTVFL